MENQDEKTEEPTSRKLDKAREKGDVPKSQEVNSLAILMASFCSIWLFGSYFQQSFLNSMKETLGNLHIDISTVESIRPIMKNFVLDTFIISGPF